MSASMQGDLFADMALSLPEGFRYEPDIVSGALQAALVRGIAGLRLKPFDFHGFEARRRVVSFGWKYDREAERLKSAEEIPPFLVPARDVAAAFAGIDPARLQQALVSEYAPGAPIGWHRDKPVFGRVVGISLLSRCTFRLRRRTGTKWERASVVAEPGSAYMLSGLARTQWEHSIPPVEQLRYSITFRELG